MDIWIWQTMLTPHMAYFAESLTGCGHNVTYVATQLVSDERKQQGWEVPVLKNIKLKVITAVHQIGPLLYPVDSDSVHLCQGIRGNGLIREVQSSLVSMGFKYWVLMETLDDVSLAGIIKRPLYRWLLRSKRNEISGILAIGHRTVEWLLNRGCSSDRVFPFAYFLQPVGLPAPKFIHSSSVYRFLFVGRLIALKRLDLLLHSLSRQSHDFELVVVGDGPMRSQWQDLSDALLPGKVQWHGRALMSDVPEWMSAADCLVLPSRHDGWGAVVSEALMMGTPVICSDACGSAEVVQCSDVGGVFRSGDVSSLTGLIGCELVKGRSSLQDRFRLSQWAQCLGGVSGSHYFNSILEYANSEIAINKPAPPWRQLYEPNH